jgi:hypothetical protein
MKFRSFNDRWVEVSYAGLDTPCQSAMSLSTTGPPVASSLLVGGVDLEYVDAVFETGGAAFGSEVRRFSDGADR